MVICLSKQLTFPACLSLFFPQVPAILTRGMNLRGDAHSRLAYPRGRYMCGIECSQQCPPRCVSAGASCPYAWDEPTGRRTLALSLPSAGVRFQCLRSIWAAFALKRGQIRACARQPQPAAQITREGKYTPHNVGNTNIV